MQQLWWLRKGSEKVRLYQLLQGLTWPNLKRASSARAGSKRRLINRETAFIYPGLFTIWILSLGAFPMLPVGSGIALGCKGLLQNIHPSKPSIHCPEPSLAPRGWTFVSQKQLHLHVNFVKHRSSQVSPASAGLRRRHLYTLGAVETKTFGWTSSLISVPTDSAHLFDVWIKAGCWCTSAQLKNWQSIHCEGQHVPSLLKGAARLTVQQTWLLLRSWTPIFTPQFTLCTRGDP